MNHQLKVFLVCIVYVIVVFAIVKFCATNSTCYGEKDEE